MVTKENLQVKFQEPEPSFSQNEKIVRPAIDSQNQYTIQHSFPIPVEDQRLVATPAKVGYDVPVFHYQYVPTQTKDCQPCCGCNGKVTIENSTNLYQYGEKRPENKWE